MDLPCSRCGQLAAATRTHVEGQRPEGGDTLTPVRVAADAAGPGDLLPVSVPGLPARLIWVSITDSEKLSQPIEAS